MFIGNHTCTGADMALMQWNLTQHLDIFLRGIAHWGHFNLPWWATIMRWVGAVPGTRKICSELLTKGYVYIYLFLLFVLLIIVKLNKSIYNLPDGRF